MKCFCIKRPAVVYDKDDIPGDKRGFLGRGASKPSQLQNVRGTPGVEPVTQHLAAEPPATSLPRWWTLSGWTGATNTLSSSGVGLAVGATPAPPKEKTVKVAVVVRPLVKSERMAQAQQAIFVQRPSRVLIPAMSFGGSMASGIAEHSFDFHRVYMMDNKEPATQLFDEMLQPAIADRFLKGVNTTLEHPEMCGSAALSHIQVSHKLREIVSRNCPNLRGIDTPVFAYGQGGAGKSTALGMRAIFANGLFQQCIVSVWEALDAMAAFSTVVVVTFVELHNGQIRDLLSERTGLGKLRECPVNGPWIENVTELRVTEADAVLQAVAQGIARRVNAGRDAQGYRHPNRAHAIFTLVLTQYSGQKPITSKLQFVDLAGSDGVRGKAEKGRAATEAATVSKELLALGNVISAATAVSEQHVPYRNSLLTRVLQDCPGRESETILLACLSAADTCHDHSLHTLRFAERANARNLPVLMREEADEASYLRRIVEGQKLESIAACNALAAQLPTDEDQLCVDFAFEREPWAAAPIREPSVQGVPYVAPLASRRVEAKVRFSPRAAAAWDTGVAHGAMKEEALSATGPKIREWCAADSASLSPNSKENSKLEAQAAARSRRWSKARTVPVSPERAEWDDGYSNSSQLVGGGARAQDATSVIPETLPGWQSVVSAASGGSPGKEAARYMQPTVSDPKDNSGSAPVLHSSPQKVVSKGGADTPPQQWELRMRRLSMSGREHLPAQEMLPLSLDEEDISTPATLAFEAGENIRMLEARACTQNGHVRKRARSINTSSPQR